MSKNDDTLEEVEFVGPGAMLKTAREKVGLSQDEVADKLHLRASIISGLEDDQYATDISPTFTKGYLKLYSKLLGLNSDDVLEAYKKLGKLEKEPAKLQSFSKKVAKQASDKRLMMFTYLVIVILIALAVIFGFQQDAPSFKSMVGSSQETKEPAKPAVSVNEGKANANSSAKVTEADIETNANDVSAGVSDDVKPEVVELPTVEESSSPNDANNDALENEQLSQMSNDSNQPASETSQETPDAIEATDSSSVPSSDEGESAINEDNNLDTELPDDTVAQEDSTDEAASLNQVDSLAQELTLSQEAPLVLGDAVDLVFEFAGDCWMKLTDATGEDVAYGIKKSGRVMPVSGIPPFEVVLGAPEVVQISYNGEPIDMTQFRAGYTARFTLPLSE